MSRVVQAMLAGVLLLISRQGGAFDYVLPDLTGEPQSLDQFRGKWVVVNYWATWCATCVREIPELVALHEANEERDITVVGINFESNSTDRLKDFVAAQGISYPVLRSEPVPVTAIGKVPALPTTYIIDPDGKIVAGEVGLVTRQQLEDYIAGRKAAQASGRTQAVPESG